MAVGMTGKGVQDDSKHCHPEERKRREDLTGRTPLRSLDFARDDRKALGMPGALEMTRRMSF